VLNSEDLSASPQNKFSTTNSRVRAQNTLDTAVYNDRQAAQKNFRSQVVRLNDVEKRDSIRGIFPTGVTQSPRFFLSLVSTPESWKSSAHRDYSI
jgi:hypothetical protein